MEEISVAGKQYITSKRAAQLSGYAQDYIGQLARGGLIDAHRVGGLWYVSLESLMAYKVVPEAKAAPSVPRPQTELESLITFDGRDYVSASRAAKMTGYHQDYIGQLARSGKIQSRQVGNRWYIDREGLMAHKEEKDRLLASVQVDSVGLAHRMPAPATVKPDVELYRYVTDEAPLLPLAPVEPPQQPKTELVPAKKPDREGDYFIPITVIEPRTTAAATRPQPLPQVPRAPLKRRQMPIHLVGAALTVVIVIAVGYASLGESAVYARASSQFSAAVQSSGDALEELLTDELIYIRGASR